MSIDEPTNLEIYLKVEYFLKILLYNIFLILGGVSYMYMCIYCTSPWMHGDRNGNNDSRVLAWEIGDAFIPLPLSITRGRAAQSSRCGQKTSLMANLKINFACPYRWSTRNGTRAHPRFFSFFFSSLPPRPLAPPHHSPRRLLFSRNLEISIGTALRPLSRLRLLSSPREGNRYLFGTSRFS